MAHGVSLVTSSGTLQFFSEQELRQYASANNVSLTQIAEQTYTDLRQGTLQAPLVTNPINVLPIETVTGNQLPAMPPGDIDTTPTTGNIPAFSPQPMAAPAQIILPFSTGGTTVQQSPNVVATIMRQLLPAFRSALIKKPQGILGPFGGGSFGGLSLRGIWEAIMVLLGISEILSHVLDMGGTENDAAMIQHFFNTINAMQEAGMVHPWTSRNPEDPGPKYFIMDLENAQGFYANFHMSRSGLARHDEKQDTYKRPRQARRSTRTPARR